MRLRVTNIKFPAVVNDQIKVPVVMQPVQDWLDEYKLNDDPLITYIRTALFNAADPTYDVEEVTDLPTDIEADQPLCLDAFDHEHAMYKDVNVSVIIPYSFIFDVTDEDYELYKDETGDALHHSIAYEHLMNWLPLTINVTETYQMTEEQLQSRARMREVIEKTIEYKLAEAYEYLDSELINADEIEHAEHNIYEWQKDIKARS